VTWSANDYYYTCVTKESGNWDKVGDMFIGRLCTDDEMDLANIVTKIKHNENEYSFDDWRTINTLAYGGDLDGNPVIEHKYFCEDLLGWLDEICNPIYTNTLIDITTMPFPQDWKTAYLSHLNSPGSNIVFHYGHGTNVLWKPDLSLDYKMINMSNNGKYPFVISQSCNTGGFTNISSTPDCMAERMVLYDDDNGYVAYLGSWPATGGDPTPIEFPSSLQERILSAIYQNLSHVLGEAILEARIGVFEASPNGYGATHFQYNLFGDPAINLMALGYELTHNVELEGINIISTPVHVKNNANLTMKANSELHLENFGQLIIEEGSTLFLANNVKILGKHANNKIRIEGILTGVTGSATNPEPIFVPEISSLPGTSWPGIEFANPELVVKIEGGSISNCQLTGQLDNLELTNSLTFQNSAIVIDQASLYIDQCNFGHSHISLTNTLENEVTAQIQNCQFLFNYTDAMIRLEHYPTFVIENCTIKYASGTGIDLYYSGEENSQYLITQNLIERLGGGQVTSWGVKIYSSFADIINNKIINNRYGVSCLNNSQVKIMGNPGAGSPDLTQNITNNF